MSPAPRSTTAAPKKAPREKTVNRKLVEFACAQAVHKAGHYLGYRLTVGEDLRVTLYAYAASPKNPKSVIVAEIDNAVIVRAAMEIGNRPVPRDPSKIKGDENEAE